MKMGKKFRISGSDLTFKLRLVIYNVILINMRKIHLYCPVIGHVKQVKLRVEIFLDFCA